MIAETLPHTRRHLRDPIGVNDVAEIVGAAAEQLFDLATHFESISREPEAHALSRVALQLMSQALFFRSTRKLGSTKNFDVVIMSLRSAGTIDGETYQDLTKALAGENLKASRCDAWSTRCGERKRGRSCSACHEPPPRN